MKVTESQMRPHGRQTSTKWLRACPLANRVDLKANINEIAECIAYIHFQCSEDSMTGLFQMHIG